MSLSADPASTISVKFEKIDGTKLPVVIRFMTRRESMKHDALCESLAALKVQSDELWAELRKIYEIAMVSPTFDELDGMLSENDIIYLTMNYPAAVHVAERELGKSKSRRLIAAVESAATATAETA